MNPQLASELVTLDPLRAEHADGLFPILSDRELWRYAPQPSWKTLDELRDKYARLESRRGDDGSEYWLNWTVRKKSSGQIVGFVQSTVDKMLRKASIAYVIARSCWGQGLATSAVAAMLTHLKTVGVIEIRATVDSRNERSIRLLTRLGFSIEDASDVNNVVFALSE